MAQLLFDEVDNWGGGVITNVRPDKVRELNAFPRGRNCQLYNIGPGSAIIATRPGLDMDNTAGAGGIILGQMDYRRYTGSSFTTYHLLITSNGKLKVINDTNGSVSDADAGNATPFTAGSNYPDKHTANNLAYIVNGVENVTFNGTNVQKMGIVAPAAPTAVDSGVAGNPNGAYDFATTYYNSAKGQESSLSPSTSVTVANKKITVSWSNSSDTQVDTTRVYIRKGTLSGSYFRLIVSTTPSSNGNGGFPLATTSITVDITDALINALTNLAPSLSENNPPPVLDKIQYHQGRLFGVAPTNPSTLLFGKLSSEGLESFDPNFTIPVNVNDGDRITAIESANEVLLIFKSRSIYMLVGTYPDWDLRVLTDEMGCVGHQSYITINSSTFFWSQFGPAIYQPGNVPIMLGQPNIANAIDSTKINFNIISNAVVGLDAQNLRLLWAVPDANSSDRNTIIFPFSIRLGVFESDQWNVIDVASLAKVIDANGVPQLYFGDYGGRVWKFNSSTYNDGVPTATTKTGTGASYTTTTLTDTTATFYTTGDGLKQLYVYVLDPNGQNLQRKRIGSNTATALTLDTGLTWDTTPTSGYTYYVGGPDFELDFGWNSLQQNFIKKRYQFLYFDLVPPTTGTATINADVFTNFSTTVSKTISFTTTASVGTSKWDVTLWDSGLWGDGAAIDHKRLRMALSGRNMLVRVRSNVPDAPIAITRMGYSAEVSGDKS